MGIGETLRGPIGRRSDCLDTGRESSGDVNNRWLGSNGDGRNDVGGSSEVKSAYGVVRSIKRAKEDGPSYIVSSTGTSNDKPGLGC